MQLVLVKIDSPEWNYIWDWLSKHPINKDLENPLEAENNGQVWQYTGTYKEANKAIHSLRHRYHPITNKQENLSLISSSTFNSDDIEKSIKI